MVSTSKTKKEKVKEQVKQMIVAYAVFKKSLDGLYIKRNRVIAEIRQRQNLSKVSLLMAKLKRM